MHHKSFHKRSSCNSDSSRTTLSPGQNIRGERVVLLQGIRTWSGMNKNGWKKDPDARRRRWGVDHRWRQIHPFPAFMRPIIPVAMVTIISVVVMTIVMFVFVPILIVTVGRRHTDAADERGDNEAQQHHVRSGSGCSCYSCFHGVTRFLDRFQSPVWRQSVVLCNCRSFPLMLPLPTCPKQGIATHFLFIGHADIERFKHRDELF